MELLTVEAYAKSEEICLAAAYKRVKTGYVQTERKFGRILIKVNPTKQRAKKAKRS